MVIHLGRLSPNASCNLPGRLAWKHRPYQRLGTRRPYLVLLPVGFTLPSPLPGTRCALTAPFHPYRPSLRWAGGLLSVALSLGSPPPGVTRRRVPVEPGLSSPRSRKNEEQPSDRLTQSESGLDCARRQVIRAQRLRNLANVSASITPSMQDGRKCLWNAIVAAVGSVSSNPYPNWARS